MNFTAELASELAAICRKYKNISNKKERNALIRDEFKTRTGFNGDVISDHEINRRFVSYYAAMTEPLSQRRIPHVLRSGTLEAHNLKRDAN